MELHLALDHAGDLTGQIVHQIRNAIQAGRLEAGARMPPTRLLGTQLGVARKTVTTAYERLVAEGWLHARVGDGTYVAEGLARKPVRIAAAPVLPPAVQRWMAVEAPFLGPAGGARYAFQPGQADTARFPHEAWSRCVRTVLAAERQRTPGPADPCGEMPLRQAIATHIAFTRGVQGAPTDILVTAGAQQGIDLVARLLLGPGAVVAMENPGYPMARALFQGLGARVVPVPVDGEGLVVETLPGEATLVFVTPSHQSPLGMPMSLARRQALLDWAARRHAVILEDDYDSEFRYGGQALDALQTLDRHGRVVYLGTFSKTLLANLRCGYLVVPPWLMPAARKVKHLMDWYTPTLIQHALARFMSEGHLLRHIRRSHARHAQRRSRLLARLHGDLSPWLEALPAMAGFHLAARLRVPVAADALVAMARLAELELATLDPFYATPPPTCAGLLLGFGAIDLLDIDPALDRLAMVLSALAPEPAHVV
ncbi:PLP-dependent aminotransferase family protein [Cupriavidus consociatus]|uniref:MocR-like pyridoxine biosynthesis transcription factor PdxR n=1 Tax=Cupriavidus consociatus TaxID=2821357 RepID=UPI001AE3F3AD|nr:MULTISPECIES: PLP-dependent aminotransferase family protein [unclassified Cupriavidus]MBP0622119.1 PLP-dependent aminotransferase family protein [Cupriavidus sp. LEh25]MDK2658796.1 PLP-dependent aminotransferase family protein [Cupriavidus sp. LEh21]